MRRRIITLLLILAIGAAALLSKARSKPTAPPAAAATRPANVADDFLPGESVYRIRSLQAVIEQSLFHSTDGQLLTMLHGADLARREEGKVDLFATRDGNSMIENELRERAMLGMLSREALDAHKDDSRPIFAAKDMPPTVAALCTDLLAQWWAPPDSMTREQRLIAAAYCGDPSTVAKLIADGANVNAMFGIPRNDAPASKAVARARMGLADMRALVAVAGSRRAADPLGTAKLLIEAGARVNEADSAEETALFGAVYEDRLDLARYLLDHGADIKHISYQGLVPLYVAARDPQMLELLLSRGADLNYRDVEGYTQLYKSMQEQNPVIIQRLINAGAKVNVPDRVGRSPLHIASNHEVARLLIAAGARLDLRDEEGFTPLMRAEWSAEALAMEQAAYDKSNGPRPSGTNKYSMIVWRGPDLKALKGAGMSGQMLVHRMNDMRSTERKGVAHVLKEAGAK